MRTLTKAAVRHELILEPGSDLTRGACTCGAWLREVGADVVAVTGKSREEALRAAHSLHARGVG